MNIQIEIAGAKHLLTVDEARNLWVELRELFVLPRSLIETAPPIMPTPPPERVWTTSEPIVGNVTPPITFTDNGDDEAAGAVA